MSGSLSFGDTLGSVDAYVSVLPSFGGSKSPPFLSLIRTMFLDPPDTKTIVSLLIYAIFSTISKSLVIGVDIESIASSLSTDTTLYPSNSCS